MKKSIVIAAVLILFAKIANAQVDSKSILTNEITSPNSQESVIKKEKDAHKKAFTNLKSTDISYQTREQFIRDFGDIPIISAKKTNHFEEIVFEKDGKNMTAYYDIDSKLVGTTSQKAFEDLPGKAQIYILEKYPNQHVEEVIMFDDDEQNDTDMYYRGRMFEDADNYFVELKQDNTRTILKVTLEGGVTYFATIK
jgi:hypothetical protein